MKARKVKGLDPSAPLADEVERIARVRLKELASFAPRALDPDEEEAQHDMRIAAKRLRYLLELTAPCFGPYAAKAAAHAREIQDLLGEVHDCDVMLPRVRAHVAEVEARDVAAVRERAGRAGDLDPALTAQAPERPAYAGLALLAVHLQARRGLLFERFVAHWRRLEAARWRERLEAALGERGATMAATSRATGGAST